MDVRWECSQFLLFSLCYDRYCSVAYYAVVEAIVHPKVQLLPIIESLPSKPAWAILDFPFVNILPLGMQRLAHATPPLWCYAWTSHRCLHSIDARC